MTIRAYCVSFRLEGVAKAESGNVGGLPVVRPGNGSYVALNKSQLPVKTPFSRQLPHFLDSLAAWRRSIFIFMIRDTRLSAAEEKTCTLLREVRRRCVWVCITLEQRSAKLPAVFAFRYLIISREISQKEEVHLIFVNKTCSSNITVNAPVITHRNVF